MTGKSFQWTRNKKGWKCFNERHSNKVTRVKHVHTCHIMT